MSRPEGAADGGDRLEIGGRSVVLRRLHATPGSSLIAYRHGEVAALGAVVDVPGPLLLVGDGHGALAWLLRGVPRTVVVDLDSSRRAIAYNGAALGASGDDDGTLSLASPLELPDRAADGAAFAAVAWVWPRSLAEADATLARLGATLPAGTALVVGMRNDEPGRRGAALLARRLDDLVIGRADGRRRVARGRLRTSAAPAPRHHLGPDGVTLWSHAGVFAHGAVDDGAERLLAALAGVRAAAAPAILDLGCGDGVLGVVAARRLGATRLLLVDDSALAVASARMSAEAAGLGERLAVDALHACELDGVAAASFDLVLCNPPFHDQGAITRATAARMFADAARVLRPDGSLVVVGNRHLGYDARLRRLFGSVAVLTADRRFVVLRATRPRPRRGDAR